MRIERKMDLQPLCIHIYIYIYSSLFSLMSSASKATMINGDSRWKTDKRVAKTLRQKQMQRWSPFKQT